MNQSCLYVRIQKFVMVHQLIFISGCQWATIGRNVAMIGSAENSAVDPAREIKSKGDPEEWPWQILGLCEERQ